VATSSTFIFILLYSLFVLLKGASKEEAFRIGKEIVEAVTADNPKPVKLKFEKVPSQNVGRHIVIATLHRCICHVCCRQRNDMLVMLMSPWTRKSQYLMQRVLRPSVVMAVLLLSRSIIVYYILYMLAFPIYYHTHPSFRVLLHSLWL